MLTIGLRRFNRIADGCRVFAGFGQVIASKQLSWKVRMSSLGEESDSEGKTAVCKNWSGGDLSEVDKTAIACGKAHKAGCKPALSLLFFFPACFQQLPRILHDGFGLVLRQDES
jgi:hypothetical protein